MTPSPNTAFTPRPFRRRVAGLAALSSLVMISLGAQAQGMSSPSGGPGMGGMPGHAGPMGSEAHGGMRHGRPGMEPGDMAQHMDRRIEMMAREAGATPEQKEKLQAISRAAMADLKPLHEQQMQSRRKAMELLAAPTIDKAALEQLRVAQNQTHDSISKRMLQSMVDSAEVLKPEQRARLAEGMKKRMDRMAPPKRP